ncbi:MAG: carbon-nitrogen hydrolase family protein [Candidatus Bathyarchaeota archaeon]
MGQMLVKGGEIEENLNSAERMISNASRGGCEIIVLPECLDVGWTHTSARILAQGIPGETSDRLCRNAADNKIMIVAGLTECEDDRVYNSAILIDSSGKILLKHRKINVLNIAQDLYEIGTILSVKETRFGTIGINICADNFRSSHEIGHVLARMGAHFIFSPSSWVVDPKKESSAVSYGKEWQEWKNSYAILCRLYGLSIIGVSNVGLVDSGPWKGRNAIGGSLAMGPNGKLLTKGPYGPYAEALVIVNLKARERTVKGISYVDYLKEKGYTGV